VTLFYQFIQLFKREEKLKIQVPLLIVIIYFKQFLYNILIFHYTYNIVIMSYISIICNVLFVSCYNELSTLIYLIEMIVYIDIE